MKRVFALVLLMVLLAVPRLGLMEGDDTIRLARTLYTLGKGERYETLLDLGTVYECARVLINGQCAGEMVMPPYRLGAWLLSRLGFRDDAYLNLVADARQPDMMTVLHLLEKDGGFYMDLDAYGGLDDTLRLLHYDRLLGGQYGGAWRSGQ